MKDELRKSLEPVAQRRRELLNWRRLTRCWLTAAAAGLLALGAHWLFQWYSAWVLPALLGGAFAGVLFVRSRNRSSEADIARVVRQIEEENPRLHTLLLTAAEQTPSETDQGFNYLQEQLIREAVNYDQNHPWGHRSYEQLFFALCGHWAALLLFALVTGALWFIRPDPGNQPKPFAGEVEVTPGDTELERGNHLVVLARFHLELPESVTLVVQPAGGLERRIPLDRNLDDPVFGGRLASGDEDFTYQLEYGEKSTRAFSVDVFEYPRLAQADAVLTYPEYTQLPEKTVKDTRRISAIEGTRLHYEFNLNKAVRQADLVAEDGTRLPLTLRPDAPHIADLDLELAQTGRFTLSLLDADNRANRTPAEFSIEVVTNQPPQLKLVAPRGDEEVSPLEEVNFQAKASDDFGLERYGIAFQHSGESVDLELGEEEEAHAKVTMDHLLALEELDLVPGQLVTYSLWAEDLDGQGQLRRTYSDVYLLEVRPLEQIFREGQSPSSQQSSSSAQSQNQSEGEQLLEIQKKVMISTWKMMQQGDQQPVSDLVEGVEVLREAQQHALDMLREMDTSQQQSVEAPRLLAEAEAAMEKALAQLSESLDQETADPLQPAFVAETAASEALLKLQTREFQVARGQGQGQGSGSSNRSQRQLDQLELKQSENRYANESQASPLQNPAQQERLRFLARLNELAQRQQDLNRQIQELQIALESAESEEEREELQRRLQRLKEDQRQMLADVDEVQQRMNREENQATTAESRPRLEETRSQIEEAAESVESGQLSQALASGRRAERELQDLRDDFRNETSSQLAEDLESLNRASRDLAQREEEIRRSLAAAEEADQARLSNSGLLKEIADQIGEQSEGFTNLLGQLRQVAEQAESAEPLVAQDLQEAFRQAAQADAQNLRDLIDELLQAGQLTRSVYDRLRSVEPDAPAKSLTATETFLREGELPEARRLEDKVQTDLEKLQVAIGEAVSSVVGDNSQALELAQAELDDLLRDLNEESLQANSAASSPNNEGANSPSPGEPSPGGDPSATANAAPPRSGSPTDDRPGRPGDGSGGGEPGSPNPDPNRTPSDPATLAGGNPDGQNPGSPSTAFFNQPGARQSGGQVGGPITGGGYREWVDRLAQVESLLDLSEVPTPIRQVRDRVQAARAEYRRHGTPPQWALVELEVVEPLRQIREQVRQELQRRKSTESLVPLDRDAVPPQYADLVRRYYESLGSEP